MLAAGVSLMTTMFRAFAVLPVAVSPALRANTHKVIIHVSFGVFVCKNRHSMFRALAATGNKGVNGTFWEYAIFCALARVTVRRAVVQMLGVLPVAVRDAVRGAAARIGVITDRIQTLVAFIVGRAVAALIVELFGPPMLAARFSVFVVSTTMFRAFVVLPVAVSPALLGGKKNNGHSQKRSQCQDDRSHSQGPLDCTHLSKEDTLHVYPRPQLSIKKHAPIFCIQSGLQQPFREVL